jgi:biopolymer transport protein ExbD
MSHASVHLSTAPSPVSRRSVLVLAVTLSACSDAPPLTVVRLQISPSGSYTVNGQPVTDEALSTKLAELNSASSNVQLDIAADSSATHASVVTAFQAAKVAGIVRVAFVTTHAQTK